VIEYVIWIGGLVATILATTLLARIALRILAEAQRQAPPADRPKPSSNQKTPSNPLEAFR
jgi:hypothetical protein